MTNSTDTDPTPNLFAAITAATHRVTMEHPKEDTAQRSARVVDALHKALQPWAKDCLKHRPDEPLANSVARMIVIAMVCGYDWLASTLANELHEAGIEIEPDYTMLIDGREIESPSGMVH